MEMALWTAHFGKRPHDAVERLLAELLALMLRVYGGKDHEKTTMLDVAPWLGATEPGQELDRDAFAREIEIALRS